MLCVSYLSFSTHISTDKCNMGLRGNREIRIALYSFFLGVFITYVVTVLISLSVKTKRNRKTTNNRCNPETEAKVQYINPVVCPECPKPVCPLCPDTPIDIPDTLEEFIFKHIVESKNGPLVITRTRMKSVPSYFLSLHPSERDMQISHSLSTRGDWNHQLIRTVCHVMQTAPEGAYFVDVGAYVGSLAFGVAMCGMNVAAFEPYPHTFRLLQESMALNHFNSDQVKLYNMAMGNATGTACLAASSSDRSMARIYTGQCQDDEVAIDKLDRVLQGVVIWYLYMDTGGFEPGILTGAQSFLTGPNPPRYIQFKASHSSVPKEAMGTKLDLTQTLKWLETLGYALRDESNEPIYNVEEFVMELGHEMADVVAIYQKKDNGRQEI